MKSPLLFSNRYKWIGLLIAVPSAVLGMIYLYFDYEIPWLRLTPKKAGAGLGDLFENQNFTDELIVVGLAVGLIMIAFSKEKTEDEFVARVRLESLQWAVLVNAVILILCTIFIYGGTYFTVMVFNMFTPLIFFIGRFHYVLYRNNQSITAESRPS